MMLIFKFLSIYILISLFITLISSFLLSEGSIIDEFKLVIREGFNREINATSPSLKTIIENMDGTRAKSFMYITFMGIFIFTYIILKPMYLLMSTNL